MLFNQNKGFFLTLDETAEPVSLDLPEAAAVEEPAADASVTAQPSLVVAAVEAPAASEATTSEAKAPGNLVAGTGLRSRNRRPGAGMKMFMTIAGDLFKS